VFALALVAAACVPAAIAAAEFSSDAPAGGLFQSLSSRQKLIMFVDMRRETAGMTDIQRKPIRQKESIKHQVTVWRAQHRSQGIERQGSQ
jgi:hypothetical protein